MVAPGSHDAPTANGMKREITNDLAAVVSDPHATRIETAMLDRRGTKVEGLEGLEGRTRRVEVIGRLVGDGRVEARVRVTIKPTVVGSDTRNPMATSHARSERRFPPGAMRLRG